MYQETLEQSIAAGRWALLNTIVQRVLAFGTFIILARLLTPADFGVIALVAIVPAFLDGVTSFAFDTAALQKGNMERYLNAIWTFNILRALAIFIAVFAGAPWIADFYHIPEAELVVRLAALGILIQNFGNIGQALFFRDLDFKSVFLRDLAFKGSFALAAIALAIYLENYWALFIAGIVSCVVVALATYLLHSYRPRFDFNFGLLKELRSFSQWMYAQESVQQIALTIQDSVIGRFTSPSAIGLFQKAQSLSEAPTSSLISLINKVSFTSYVRVQDSQPHVAEGIYKTMDIISAIAIPYLFCILIAGNAIVTFVFGPAWVAMTPLLMVLVVEATLDVLAISLASSVFNAVGRAHTQFLNTGIRSLTLAGAMLLLVPTFGIMGAAYAALASVSITACVVLYHLITKLKIQFGRIGRTLLTVLGGCLLPLPFASYALTVPFFNTAIGFLSLLSLGAIVYISVIIIVGRLFQFGPYSTLELLVHSFLRSMNIRRFDGLFLDHEQPESA